MRDRYEDIRAHGAAVAAIGMGWPAAAAHFRDEQEIPFPLLVDHTKETYRVLELGRGSLIDVAGPKVWWRGAKGLATGHGVGAPRQDPYQLGGVAVIDPEGRVRLLHRSKTSADNLPVDDILAAL